MHDIEKLEDRTYKNKIVTMYEELNVSLVQDILKRIKETGDFSTYTKSQLRVLKRRGGSEIFKKALLETNKLSARRKKELMELYKEVIKADISDYKSLYEYKELPFELSNQQLIILNKMIKLSDKELKNFTKTIAFSTREEFIKSVDEMYQQVATGGIDFKTAFRKATNELAKKGITLPMSNGNNRSIEAAVRQNVLYGIRRTSQMINDDLIDYLEADAVEINITPNCRPDHRAINGKIFSLKKGKSKYPYFSRRYQALMEEYGCQHYKSPFITGVSEPVYTKKEVKEANAREVSYKGNKIPYYEATQKQRALEREIRNAKRNYLMSDTPEEKKKARQQVSAAQKKIREYINETGLTRDYDREYYAKYNN